jgi:hypothetical protein
LVLHDSCLYESCNRKLLKICCPKTWNTYSDFIQRNGNVMAVSIHAPYRWECSLYELETNVDKLQDFLQVPVFVETMATKSHWCSSLDSLPNSPLLLDVSHVLIWFHGDSIKTEYTCQYIMSKYNVKSIHLSHNGGVSDSHELIPIDAWFNHYIDDWRLSYMVTYESLPSHLYQYQRLDKYSLSI